jgi:serine/threonine protein kinase
MNVCKTCGHIFAENAELKTCPTCVVIEVLGEELESEQESPSATPSKVFSPLIRRLPTRHNFFDKYQIVKCIGRGGQGRVWKVFDYEFRRVLAMKGLNEEMAANDSACYRFLAEAQITSQLRHQGILPVYDLGLDFEGKPFYTLELILGSDLGEKLSALKADKWTKTTLSQALEIIVRVCEIVGHAHSRGVIHRDLKPTNVLVGKYGDVRVIDWGSAAILKGHVGRLEEPFVRFHRSDIQTDRAAMMASHPEFATGLGGWPSTLIYTAPELVAGKNDQLGPESDIYSIGVLLYELLAGRLPYSDENGKLPDASALGQLIPSRHPVPIRVVNPRQSKDLAAIAEKAMAHEKESRYHAMEDLAAEIRAALELRPVQARQPGPLLKVQRLLQRHPGPATLIGLILVILAVAFSVVRGVEAQKRVERQLRALEEAELARRYGHWREALTNWDLAESTGYKDTVYLDLQRAEAWTILSEPNRSGALLKRLSQRRDLGALMGVVFLRLGEHELFDQATASQGVQHVREALATRLDPADELFAKGLLADSTPEALDFFHQAIKINSFHHGAHRHSLGLEFLLGHHSDLQDSLRFFSAIYPDDPSAGFLEAAELAMHGRLEEARARMIALRSSAGAEEWAQLNDSLPMFATAAKRFDPDTLLTASRPAFPSLDFFTAAERVSGINIAEPNSSVTHHMPYLPSIQKGLLEGRAALTMMMLPSIGNIDISVARIKTSWQHHPEALVPVFAGIYLEMRQPTNGPKSIHLLKLQADLFQLAADSPSLLAGLDRTSRHLAAKTEFELLQSDPTNAASLRKSCLGNIHRALSSPETSIAEFKAYFSLAMKLGDYDLARALIVRWEQEQPQEASTLPFRIEVEIATGNLDAAWKLVNRTLAVSPNDARALTERETIQKKLAELIELIYNSAKFNSFPGKL